MNCCGNHESQDKQEKSLQSVSETSKFEGLENAGLGEQKAKRMHVKGMIWILLSFVPLVTYFYFISGKSSDSSNNYEIYGILIVFMLFRMYRMGKKMK